MEDTWGSRELPVLSAVVTLLEESYMVTVSDIAEKTGLELTSVSRSLEAMDPTYVDFRKTETGGDPRFWYVNRVTPAAREEAGQADRPAGLGLQRRGEPRAGSGAARPVAARGCSARRPGP